MQSFSPFLFNQKLSVFLLSLLFCNLAVAQNVAINNDGSAAAASAILEVKATNQGILIPRMNIANLNTAAPVTAPANSLLVFNTNTTTGPGYFYWNGTRWVAVGNDKEHWTLLGNTIAATSYIGSNNNQPFRFYSNGAERMRILTNGKVAVNSTTTFATSTFYSAATGNNNAIDGNAAGSGDAIYGQTTGTGSGVTGFTNNVNAVGVVGHNTHNDGVGVYGTSSGTGAGAVNVPGIGVLGEVNNNNSMAIWGENAGTSGTGTMGIGQDVGTGTYLVSGSGGAFSAYNTGLYVHYSTPFPGSGIVIQDNFGAQWDVGVWNGSFSKILGNGTASTVVQDLNDERVVMFCPEAPEVLFQDYGTGSLENGFAAIELDPILTKNIVVDEDHPLKVFVQVEGDCNGVYVANKTQYGFEVKELQGGTSNVPFSWSITATRANETFVNQTTGEIRVSDYDVRFPPAPPIRERATLTAPKPNTDKPAKKESQPKTGQ